MEFQIYQDENGQYRIRIIAGNHEIMFSGESYTTKQNAEKAIKSLILKIMANEYKVTDLTK